jgi:DNA-binding phage protein
MPSNHIPVVERTCRFCIEPAVFRSVVQKRRHELAEHADRLLPQERERAALSNAKIEEADFLMLVQRLTKTVLRGPGAPELAERIGMSRRGVARRAQRLHDRNMLLVDADGGYILTDEGRAAMTQTLLRAKG